MLLLVDAGNTRIKWALIDRSKENTALGDWHAFGSVVRSNAADLVEIWRSFKIGRIMISNVAGADLRDELAQAVMRALGTKPVAVEWFASAAMLGGVRSLYLEPAQLGCDRFAAVIGAHALLPERPLIVATCGTATTLDAVAADGVFIGGMILPGLGMMAAALEKNTAQLPEVALHTSDLHPFSDNTEAAIVSGCLAAQAGAIERAYAAQQLNHPEMLVSCILAGGAADLIVPHLKISCERVDNLVLIGLQTVATQTHSTC